VNPIDARHLGNNIRGRWMPSVTGQSRPNINPADTLDVIGDFTESGGVDVDAAVEAAVDAAPAWRAVGPIERGDYLHQTARILHERADDIAAVITREQGKLLREARGEVSRALAILTFMAGEGRRLSGVTLPADDPRTFSFMFRPPIGVVGLIAPWNFPFAIPIWKIAPALLSGCTAVLKPSPLTPLTSALVVQAVHDAGVPAGVLNLVQGDRAAGEALVESPAVAGISFTGSLPVGTTIHQAGATRLLKTQLELGGKNAVIVLDDADLDKAADAAVTGAFGQAGQRCSATSRLIVDRSVKEEVLARLAERVSTMTVGPGNDPGSEIGPVVDKDRLEDCLDAIETARGVGAKVVCGGRRATAGLPDGYYVQPTVLRDVPADSVVAQEEIFGPVLSVIDAAGFDDAMRISNSVKYGMSATIFTRSQSRTFEAIERLDAGMLHVNRPGVGAYPHLPHVGAKLSQYGPPECSPQVLDFYTGWRSACISY
jgi:acyl-CoA reductase-like NAD-dependent aldehyde dehydrogenase